MAWFGTKFEQNCWRIAPGLSAYSSQQQEKAERQQKTSRVQFCSNLVPNHAIYVAIYVPQSLPTVCIESLIYLYFVKKLGHEK